MWGCLAAMAMESKELNTAEVGLAVIIVARTEMTVMVVITCSHGGKDHADTDNG